MPTSSKYTGDAEESGDSSIMWGAIFGGALAAIGVTLILAPLGTALGLTVFSPWHHADISNHAFTVMSAIWLIITQWVAFGLGGYLTGRLRTEWVGAHTHEVFFRDTAHGFLMWALVSVIGAALLLATAAHSAHMTGVPAGTDVTAGSLLLYSLSTFVGAFIASVAAALGGHDRDHHYATGKFTD
jgi:hypothetical protein